jgi:hypothetical protein
MRGAREHARKFLEYMEQIELLTGEKAKRDVETERRAQHIYVQPDPMSTFAVQVRNVVARGQTDFSEPEPAYSDGTRVTIYYELQKVREKAGGGRIKEHWDIEPKMRPVPESKQ